MKTYTICAELDKSNLFTREFEATNPKRANELALDALFFRFIDDGLTEKEANAKLEDVELNIVTTGPIREKPEDKGEEMTV